jgi:hypothetical protein
MQLLMKMSIFNVPQLGTTMHSHLSVSVKEFPCLFSQCSWDFCHLQLKNLTSCNTLEQHQICGYYAKSVSSIIYKVKTYLEVNKLGE